MKTLSIILRSIYYGIRLMIRPTRIDLLLKLGNLLSETRAFEVSCALLLKNPAVDAIAEERYSKGFKKAELAHFPEKSLGKELYHFLNTHKLDTYPIPIEPTYSKAVYLRERRRQLHDCVHLALGAGIELKDEAAVNAFVIAQGAMPIPVLIIVGILLKTTFKKPEELPLLLESLEKAWKLGKNATNYYTIRWEEEFETPMEIFREKYGLVLV